ncbi:MAG: hypothetical protein ABI821_06630 [Pseudomonadota bacterium]
MRGLGRSSLVLLALFGGLAAHAAAQPPDTHEANPLAFFWGKSLENLDVYAKPGALVVAGNCNRYDPQFAAARAAGAEVLAYLNPIEVYDRIPCKLNEGFYNGARERVPLWPYPQPGKRINWPKTHMADMRAGSDWSNRIVAYVENLMRERKVDGVFLDNIGARLWSKLADWNSWSKAEQDAWTEGNVDLVRRIDAARRRINPAFIVVTNNVWHRGDSAGDAGEQYVDGVVLERSALNDWHIKYANRPFSNLGHRRVLVVSRSEAEVAQWARVPGVTHVSFQPNYGSTARPLLPFRALTDRR